MGAGPAATTARCVEPEGAGGPAPAPAPASGEAPGWPRGDPGWLPAEASGVVCWPRAAGLGRGQVRAAREPPTPEGHRGPPAPRFPPAARGPAARSAGQTCVRESRLCKRGARRCLPGLGSRAPPNRGRGLPRLPFQPREAEGEAGGLGHGKSGFPGGPETGKPWGSVAKPRVLGRKRRSRGSRASFGLRVAAASRAGRKPPRSSWKMGKDGLLPRAALWVIFSQVGQSFLQHCLAAIFIRFWRKKGQ